ncbi:malectin domain-containing carbohydrate-binding protein [Pedobacter insulae]|uniref:Glycosyl hydrolases family 2 n=1 Tax=Pedobacter insulae TaxID=414048 RepID=A0A1I2YFE9_9SPHI|nr:malectin domain-containing carbohydrate-binding protein [Pedobacter insulae]SFH24117.1 Glycosyl hydrolases family 2 [Pedobacter insulae]
MKKLIVLNFAVLLVLLCPALFAQEVRKNISLNNNWLSRADDKGPWEKVNVPHNWDQYEGYQRKLHGNRHGYAWYRKTFKTNELKTGKRFFLYFEGVSSYATIWLNNKKVGYHAGGRTTFTIDITSAIKLNNQQNELAVKADHPANIQDLPWVDGGCSTERGFSEGSQPMGIFRPVHLLVTNDVKIEPFGIHIWNNDQVTKKSAELNLSSRIKNYTTTAKSVTVVNQVLDQSGKVIKTVKEVAKVLPGKEVKVEQVTGALKNVTLWSVDNPYLYKIKTSLWVNEVLKDQIITPYGIRWISWPIGDTKNSKQFLLNGKPVFINGIAEYEHLLGQSHAFSKEQIKSRVMQIKAAGFNSFRDAHQPHNLLYQTYWDQLGILSWTQMAAHIWYDTPQFRKNFKALLTEWVIERRNSPSVVLWGLENESTLPEDFAKECTELIRQLDPTASSQRKVTTCNGGKGTDWDVPQNWTGTYGGNPFTYAEDLQRQVLVGEYGAWRTLDLHEVDSLGKGYTENHMTSLMETKVRLAESVKDKVAGHYFWLYSSHDNPGRVQGGEGLRDLDRIGPVNYKGMFTPWEEPTDVFYMFRANYAPKQTQPMVYIVSHTWPMRWNKPGIKDSIVVYSNCDEVELFNDVNGQSLGKRSRDAIGTHFQWNKPNIQYNVLYAVGYVNGKPVAKDEIVLNNLPQAPQFNKLYQGNVSSATKEGYHYLYRVNCGGPAYTDKSGHKWLADKQLSGKDRFGSTSWTKNFPGVPSFFASQRRTFDPIKGTTDWPLFQSFRYGRQQLKYHFPLKDGDYLVELYFIEPWLGTGGGMDATGMRLFDVAINDKLVLNDVDIWKEVGHDALLKKLIKTTVKGGLLTISFPEVKVGQAVISAIAIASLNKHLKPALESKSLIESKVLKASTWLDVGNLQYQQSDIQFTALPSNLYGAEWIQTSLESNAGINFKVTDLTDVFIGVSRRYHKEIPQGFEDTKTTIKNSLNEEFSVLRKRFEKDQNVVLPNNVAAVAVLAPTQLEPAYDLKAVTTYKATDAALKGKHIVKEDLMGRQRVVFKEQTGDVLEWSVTVGVADTYSLTLKFHNPFQDNLQATLELLSADGTLMKTEEVVLTPTKEGKWNYFSTNSGSMINAGTYKVRLTAINAKGLFIDALDVQ